MLLQKIIIILIFQKQQRQIQISLKMAQKYLYFLAITEEDHPEIVNICLELIGCIYNS